MKTITLKAGTLLEYQCGFIVKLLTDTVIECDELKARCNRLTHQLQELEAREQ